jgi:hypothetical protein
MTTQSPDEQKLLSQSKALYRAYKTEQESGPTVLGGGGVQGYLEPDAAISIYESPKADIEKAKPESQKIADKAKEEPSTRERICEALSVGTNAGDKIIEAVVTRVGSTVIAGAAVSAAVPPAAIVVGIALIILSAGRAAYCASAD